MRFDTWPTNITPNNYNLTLALTIALTLSTNPFLLRPILNSTITLTVIWF